MDGPQSLRGYWGGGALCAWLLTRGRLAAELNQVVNILDLSVLAFATREAVPFRPALPPVDAGRCRRSCSPGRLSSPWPWQSL